MKKIISLFAAVLLLTVISAGCSGKFSPEERRVINTAQAFLKARTNLNYKMITGTEGIQYTTEQGRKKMKEDASQQVSAYKDYKGSSNLASTSDFKVTGLKNNDAEVTGNFKLKTKSETQPNTNSIKSYKFKATLKKVRGTWLVDTWGFMPQ